MRNRLVLALGVLVCLAAVAAYPASSGGQSKGRGKPSPAIPLKGTFMTGSIQNAGGPLPEGQYYFVHQGEGGTEVHCRILEPVEYGPLQIYVPVESGLRVYFYFSWPPVSSAVPDPLKCGWPPFLTGPSGVDAYSGTIFLFRTRNRFVEEVTDEGIRTLKDSGVYLNLATMGENESAIAGAEIHFHDDADRWWWLGKMNYPVLVRVTRYTTRPEEWTITPITESFPGWDTPGAMELGSPNINKRVAGSWWCAFGLWSMPFELKIARLD